MTPGGNLAPGPLGSLLIKEHQKRTVERVLNLEELFNQPLRNITCRKPQGGD